MSKKQELIVTDSSEDILSDIENILDRIAKLEHPNSEKAISMIQEGSDWIRTNPEKE